MKLKYIFTVLVGMFVLSSASAEAVDEPIQLWEAERDTVGEGKESFGIVENKEVKNVGNND